MWLRSAAFVKVSHCRVPSKSPSLFSPPSLSSRSLAVGGTFGLFVSRRSIRRGHTHSVVRSRSVGG